MRGGGQNLRFLANMSLYLSNGARYGLCLLLITNTKSYTGSRLAPNLMTLNAKIGGFMDFLPFRAATQVYIIHKGAPRNYHYAIQTENLVFVY